MKAVRLVVEGSLNSFRLPLEMNYQRSYRLPPKTTVVGHLASAMGLPEEDVAPLYDSVAVGVCLRDLRGMALDLWRITKLKMPENETAVVVRELLFRPTFAFYYVPAEDSGITLERVASAFADPVYAYCLGRSDELAFPRDIRVVTLTEASPDTFYRCTLLPFAYTSHSGWRLEVVERAHELVRPPEVVRMPWKFRIVGGVREPHWGEFTVVYRMGLKLEDRRGWQDDEWNFFLF